MHLVEVYTEERGGVGLFLYEAVQAVQEEHRGVNGGEGDLGDFFVWLV